MNKKDYDWLEQLYFSIIDELPYLRMLRTGYPRWLEIILSLFYNEKFDALKKWCETKGQHAKDEVFVKLLEFKRGK